MKIKDCRKGFIQGISKVIPPEQTFKVVLRKIQNADPPILNGYFEIQRPSKIPQYRFIGTDYYRQIVQSTQGTNGKGHFKEQALASGIMELVERYSCFKYLQNRNVVRIASFKDFENGLFQLEDLYSDFIDKTYVGIVRDEELKATKILWYEGYSLNGRKVYLPMDLIVYLLEGTNGMAAGNSLEEALLHAICEVIERRNFTLIELYKLETPLIDLSTIDSPIARELIKKFQSLKNQVLIKDFSLGLGLPVVGVVRKIDKNNCIVTVGVATTGEEALIRALVENSQVEDKSKETKMHLTKHHFINNKVISIKEIINIDNRNMKLELEKIEEILNKQNMKIFFLNTTDKVLNIPSVIVYIAGAKFAGPKFFDKKIDYRNILIGLIIECLAIENYIEAEKYIDIGKDVDIKNSIIYLYYRGTILGRKKNYRGAIRCFQQVLNKVKIDEYKKLTLIQLGLCYQAVNEVNNAIDYYLKVIDLYPEFRIEHLKSYCNATLLKRFKESKLLEMAKNLYHELISIRSRFAGIKLRDYKKIFEKYQNDKKTILGYLEGAQTYFVSKHYEKAIKAANKAIELGYKEGNIHFLLGFCYEKTKQYKKAIEELKKAEKINPEEAQINFSLSNCYRNINQIEQANKELVNGTLKYKNSTSSNSKYITILKDE